MSKLGSVSELTRTQRFKQIANCINLTTPVGIGVALLGKARRRPGPRGLILAEEYRLKFPIAGAFTIGNVVITPHRFDEQRLRRFPGLIEHEERHSWQWTFCLGLPFLPLYLLAMAWSWLRTGDRASHNFFEVRAGLRSGGYLRKQTRNPISAARLGLRGLRNRTKHPEV